MGQEFFEELRAWFLLQACFCESSRWCARKEFWISANRSFVMKVILGNAHIYIYVYIYIYTYIYIHIALKP